MVETPLEQFVRGPADEFGQRIGPSVLGKHKMKVQSLSDFIWGRIGDGWLVSRDASMLLAASAVASVSGTVALSWRWPPRQPLLIVPVALGGLFLISAMERYWIKCDQGSRMARRIWFFVLTFGLWFGAALYYVFVYLPQVRREWRQT
jgi:hypothetical protein